MISARCECGEKEPVSHINQLPPGWKRDGLRHICPSCGQAASAPISASPMADAVRTQIRELIDNDPFTVGTLRAIEQIAKHSRVMLGALGSIDDAIGASPINGEDEYGSIGSIGAGSATLMGASAPENFGARAIRELVALLPKMLNANVKTSPESTVRAIAEAQKLGLNDIASDLELSLRKRVHVESKDDIPVVSQPGSGLSQIGQAPS